MNLDYEFLCVDCGETILSNTDERVMCPKCQDTNTQQCCPMCGSIIDPDTKVCPECKEPVA